MGVERIPSCLFVCIEKQQLLHFHGEELVTTYAISTSKRPPSNQENSFGTPLGLHCVAEKIGDGVPIGGVFKARVYTGQHYKDYPIQDPDEDELLITTRILRLHGLEIGKNSGPGCDTYERYVYIHGTNREEAIGTPQSHGCILLKNDDMLALYESVAEKTLVWIEDGKKN